MEDYFAEIVRLKKENEKNCEIIEKLKIRIAIMNSKENEEWENNKRFQNEHIGMEDFFADYKTEQFPEGRIAYLERLNEISKEEKMEFSKKAVNLLKKKNQRIKKLKKDWSKESRYLLKENDEINTINLRIRADAVKRNKSLQRENKNLNIHVGALTVENHSLKEALIIFNSELESYRSVSK